MTIPVWIGQGRRLTLSELYQIGQGAASLQWQQSADATASSEDASAAASEIATNVIDKDTLAEEDTLAFWTILAFQVVQIEGNASKTVHELVQAVNSRGDSNSDFVDSLDASLVTRCRRLASTVYATLQACQLGAMALPIAALTVDCSGQAATIVQKEHWYSETAFDAQRPHRSMVTAAAALRALLNDSRYVKHSSTSNDIVLVEPDRLQALRDLPQYHGPAVAQLQSILKTLELEVNSRAVQEPLDVSLLDLSQNQAVDAVTLLYQNSCRRQGICVTTSEAQQSLPELVKLLEKFLSEEAKAAVQTITEITVTATEESRQKEVEKAARAVEFTKQQGNNDELDEFKGMSEEKIAKILKKRAEKEAKAAVKSKTKESKVVSLFGAGTPTVCQILQQFQNADGTIVLLQAPRPRYQQDDSSQTIGEKSASLVQQLSDATDKLLSGGVQRKPKIPKGTRDYLPEQMMIRQQAFSIIRRVFEAHGAVEIDTPVFELKDTLTGKYGEDSKLIYDLADQGGEVLALRYDLTVPFARFLALNSVGNIKRFHIGKVYRRDQPALKRGRYREFYQCDFDIAGQYGRMVPDAECVCVVCDILDALPIGDFGIKLNHRCLLDAILDICGVPADKFRTICSAVDKLDKESWTEVKREMVEDKGLEASVADKIGEFVLNKGAPMELHKELMDSNRFGDHKGANHAMEDLRIHFEYLDAFDKLKFVSFDLSLARGLDYYTGVIYEAVCMSGETQVGSIGGGGRYDNLVSMFQEAGKQTPCVGVSVGIERVFTLMEARLRDEKGGSIKQPNVNVLIASAGGRMMKEKMKIARLLWDSKISAEFSQQENASLKKEIVDALNREIPFMVVVGERELEENKVQVKDIKANTAEDVPIPELVATLRRKGVIPVGCEFAMELLEGAEHKF